MPSQKVFGPSKPIPNTFSAGTWSPRVNDDQYVLKTSGPGDWDSKKSASEAKIRCKQPGGFTNIPARKVLSAGFQAWLLAEKEMEHNMVISVVLVSVGLIPGSPWGRQTSHH